METRNGLLQFLQLVLGLCPRAVNGCFAVRRDASGDAGTDMHGEERWTGAYKMIGRGFVRLISFRFTAAW